MSLSYVKDRLWAWPDGLVWKLSQGYILKSRRRKYNLFLSVMKPRADETILDIGVTSHLGRYSNYLELWYPHKQQITALTSEQEVRFNDFRRVFPQVKLVFGDAREMDFPDDSFDIVFSNAVVEDVGEEEEQRKFVRELVRVGKRAYVTTPNYWFPLEPHTLIPFAHYLPLRMRFCVYQRLGRNYWANLQHLNPLTPGRFLGLFPVGVSVRLFKQRSCGITATLIAVAEKARSAT